MAIENKNNVVDEEIDENEQVEDTEEVKEEEDGSGTEPEKASKNSAAKSKAPKTFTQDQVTRMMTKEKKQGKAAAYRELGIDPKDTKTIALLQSVLKNKKDSGEDDDRVSELEHRTLVAEAKAEAMQQGAQSNYVDDIVTLALSKMDDDTDVATVIGEVKSKYPVWFESSKEDEGNSSKAAKKAGMKGTGTSVKPKSNADKKQTENLGARLAAKRKANNPGKKSFWG